MSQIADNVSENVLSFVDRVAERLEAVAVDIRKRNDLHSAHGVGSHTDLADQVIRDVMWGMANLNLGALVSLAAEADLAQYKEVSL